MKTKLRQVPPPDARTALTHLWKAFAYARDTELDPWEFALPLLHLAEQGVSQSDLRWLVVNGYVHYADEVSTFRDPVRIFQPRANVAFTSETCFVLSEAGVLAAGHIDQGADSPPGRSSKSPETASLCSHLPRWDGERRMLYFYGEVVKQYRFHAANQEAVLATFQEENWPFTIDDPLSPVSDVPPKQRLRKTIKSLNANQVCRLLRFRGDGSGEHICWEPCHGGGVTANEHRRAA